MAIIDTTNLFEGVSLQNFLLFIFVIILTIVIGNIVNIFIVKLLKNKVQPVFYKTLSRILMYAIYFIGFYFAFQKILNFNVPAFLAAFGILGIALLLTILPILQNVFAGIVLNLERPFRENDIVEYNGVICLVKDIMLRKTVLRSVDGKLITVSNIKFITEGVTNYSRGEFIRVELNIDIKNDSNYTKAIGVINNVLNEDPNILPHVPRKQLNIIEKFFSLPKNPEILKPKIFIRSITKNKISLQIWFWIWDILRKEFIISNFYENLILDFKKNRIDIM